MTILEYYQKTYDSLIEKRRKFPLTKDKNDPNYVYCETHHILPKCLGGSNDETNLVNLTAREHFIAHKLLYKIAEKKNESISVQYKMFLAISYMAFHTTYNCLYFSSREYEKIKINLSKLKQNYWDLLSKEEKEKYSLHLKNSWKNMSNEDKNKMRLNMSISQIKRWKNMNDIERARLGKIFSENQKNFSKEKKDEITNKKRKTLEKNNMYEFRSNWSTNHRWVKNPITHKSKYVQKEEFDKYISNGWIPGFYKGKHKRPRNVTVFWICNDKTKENKWWKKTELIPNGWRRGRILDWTKK